jgi:hypothetical protein
VVAFRLREFSRRTRHRAGHRVNAGVCRATRRGRAKMQRGERRAAFSKPESVIARGARKKRREDARSVRENFFRANNFAPCVFCDPQFNSAHTGCYTFHSPGRRRPDLRFSEEKRRHNPTKKHHG